MIVREIRHKLVGILFAIVLPIARVILRVRVAPIIDWRILALAMVAILLYWVWVALKDDPDERGDSAVNTLLVIWSLVLTFFANI